jgi:hypothetical protein
MRMQAIRVLSLRSALSLSLSLSFSRALRSSLKNGRPGSQAMQFWLLGAGLEFESTS